MPRQLYLAPKVKEYERKATRRAGRRLRRRRRRRRCSADAARHVPTGTDDGGGRGPAQCKARRRLRCSHRQRPCAWKQVRRDARAVGGCEWSLGPEAQLVGQGTTDEAEAQPRILAGGIDATRARALDHRLVVARLLLVLEVRSRHGHLIVPSTHDRLEHARAPRAEVGADDADGLGHVDHV